MKCSPQALVAIGLIARSGLAQQLDDPAAPSAASETASVERTPDTVQPPRADTISEKPPLEVSVAGKKPLSRDRTQDATVVDGSRLRDSARASTFEALSQETADVYVSGRGALHGVASGATGGIHIRGLGGSPNSQVLVVEDGVPDYQGIFGHPIADAYVPFLIDDVLVVKGGDSSLCGTNAMGGVIVIRSRWRERDGAELQSDSAYGSYATSRETVSGLARMGAWDVAAGLHALSTDGHRDGAGGSQLIGTTGLRYRYSRNLTLTARNKVIHLEGADPGPVTHPTPDHWYDVWRDNSSLQLNWWQAGRQLAITTYTNLGVHQLYDGFWSRDLVMGSIAELGLKVNAFTDVLLGADYGHVGGKVEDRVANERTDVTPTTDTSAYSQLTVRPFPRASVVLGARELYSSRYGAVTLYKTGIRIGLFDGLAVRTRVTRNFRQPTIRELYLPYPTANPALKPEYSLNWDGGFVYATEHFQASSSVYRTEADHLIRYFGVWPSAEVVNVDHAVFWGIEGRLGLTHLGPASFYVTGDWQDVGRYTRQNPSSKLNFTLDLERRLGDDLARCSVTGEWVNGLYMADYSRHPIADVFFVDLTLRYQHNDTARGITLEPYLLLRNLLDASYAYVDGYTMPGFNVMTGLRIGI